MTVSLSGQSVLIIGGSKFLGEAIARAATKNGTKVIVGASDEARAQALADELPGASTIYIDVTEEHSIRAAAKSLKEIDHIVVTAAAHHNVPVEELNRDRIIDAFDAKIVGPMLIAKHFAPLLPRTGSYLLFSGIAAWDPTPGLSVMGVTNGAVSFLASHLAKELAPIRVNAISPGIIDSGTWDGLDKTARQELYEEATMGSLVGRVGTSTDISATAVWILENSYLSGETIHIDGGSRHA